MPLTQPRWPRVLPTRLVNGVATLGPIGMKLPAPGTWGSVAGLLYFLLFFRYARWEVIFAWSVIAGYFAIAFCGEAEVRPVTGAGVPGGFCKDSCQSRRPSWVCGWAGYR